MLILAYDLLLVAEIILYFGLYIRSSQHLPESNMATNESGWYTLASGHKVYTKTWSPSDTPQAHIAFLHGFSDRIDHYDVFFKKLTTAYPIRVHSWDRPGWGKSVHKRFERGDTGPMEKQITDLNDYLTHVLTLIPDLNATPIFLMGHSMGGQETAYYMLNSGKIPGDVRSKMKAFIVESPYIHLAPASEPWKILPILGNFFSKYAPRVSISQPLKVEYICPDVAVQKMYSEDPLCHNRGTLECFRDMIERGDQLTALGKNPGSPPKTLNKKLMCPVLWTHGTADNCVDFAASKLLCDNLESCKEGEGYKVFKSYEGWLHQLHNEPNGGQEQYVQDVGEFVMRITGDK